MKHLTQVKNYYYKLTNPPMFSYTYMRTYVFIHVYIYIYRRNVNVIG